MKTHRPFTFALALLVSLSIRGADAPATATPPAAMPTTTAPGTSVPPAPAATPEATTPPAPKPNTAIIPQLAAGFVKRHESFVEIAKKGDIDVLFMGDSITDWWRNPGRANTPPGPDAAYAGKPVFDKYFGTLKLANFGIAGDTTQGVLYRLQNGEGTGYQPKAVMLMIGTNNTGRNTGAEIAEGVTAVVQELRKDFPAARILLLAVFPRGTPENPARAKIAEINATIAKLNDLDHVFYLDIGPKFLAPDGTIPKGIMSDALHPTTRGYEIWAEAVKEPLANLLKLAAP